MINKEKQVLILHEIIVILAVAIIFLTIFYLWNKEMNLDIERNINAIYEQRTNKWMK